MAKLKIDVNDLHKNYGKNEVLKGITTKFYEGDVVCIIGPSGSGKSTFLRSLNLLEEVTSGHITVNGYDLTEKTTNVDHVRENIGMVFQHFNLFPHMSVLDNITFAPIEHKLMTKEEAENEKKKGNYVEYEEDQDGYRRIIASPKPIDIYEIDAIKALVDAHQLVIAAGGGGIPVLEQRTGLKGASAVIEKDYTAAKLADMLDASALMILTSNDYLTIDNNGTQEELKNLTAEEAQKLIDEGHFDPVTSLPKIDASLSFVLAGKGRKAIITNLSKAKEGIRGKVGTIIE